MDKDREDFDPNEWGNIELPGLTDEELHRKDWGKVTRNKERWSNPIWRDKTIAKMRKVCSSKNHKNKLIEANKKFRTDEYNKKHKKIMQDLHKSKSWKTAVEDANKNPIRNKKISKAHSRAVITPDGKFNNLAEAAKFYNLTSEGIRHRIKTKSSEWYYVDTGPTEEKYKIITSEGKFKSIAEFYRYCVKNNLYDACNKKDSTKWFYKLNLNQPK